MLTRLFGKPKGFICGERTASVKANAENNPSGVDVISPEKLKTQLNLSHICMGECVGAEVLDARVPYAI